MRGAKLLGQVTSPVAGAGRAMGARAAGTALVAAAVVLVTGTLLARTPIAYAQSRPALEARHLYEEGARWYRQGEYEKAVAAFERAFVISQAKPLLFNIAQAYRLAGPTFCARAQQAYERYLREDPAASNAREVAERISEMRACVASQRNEAAAVPVTAPSDTPVPSSPALAAEPVAIPPRSAPTIVVAPPPPGQTPRPIALAPRLTLGLGIAALASGGILYWRARAKFNDVAPTCPCPEGQFSEWQAISNTSYALLALGGVAALAGAVWWALDARGARREIAQEHVRQPIRVGVSVGPRGLSLTGVF